MLTEERKLELLTPCRESMVTYFSEDMLSIGTLNKFGEPVSFESVLARVTEYACKNVCWFVRSREEADFAMWVIDSIRGQMFKSHKEGMDYEAIMHCIKNMPRLYHVTSEAYYKDRIETSPVGTVVKWEDHVHVVDVEDAKESEGYPRLRREMKKRGITGEDLMPYMNTNRLPTVYQKLKGHLGPLEPVEMERIYKTFFMDSGIRPYHLFQLHRFDIMKQQHDAEGTAEACRFLRKHMFDKELTQL